MNRIANADSLSALIDRLIIETIKQTHLIHRKKGPLSPEEYVAVDKAQMAINETRAAIKNAIDSLLSELCPTYHVAAERRTL